MWNSEEVVVVKAEQLALASAGQSLQQVAVLQEGAVGESQAYVLQQGSVLPQTPFLCISVLEKEPQEHEEEEEEEVDRHTTEDTPASSGEAVSIEAGGEADQSAAGGVETETETGVLEGSGSAAEEPEEQAEDDPDYDPACDPQGHRAFQCHHCQRRFSTRQGLERHTHIHASTAAAVNTHTLKCRFCTKTFGTQFGRRRHERRHESERKRLGRTGSSSAPTRPTSAPTCPVNAPATSEPATSAPHLKIAPAVKIPAAVRKTALGDAATRVRGSEEGREQRGAHVCRHCRKAFGTHTNLRRHQRRVHERHLLLSRLTSARAPPVVGQKTAPNQEALSSSPPAASPAPGGSGGGEEEVEREEYMVDISSNISENLSFYIDGKIVSTSAISSCEVIEVNSGSAAVIGLDTLIISPAQIAQALKMQSAISGSRDIPGGQSASRRRTATPPLLPQIKTELESEPILTTTSSSSTPASFLPSASAVGTVVGTLVGTVLSQSADPGGTQKEKTVYLSPKLKQLLQTQDGCQPTFALISDGHRLAPPLSLTVLPSTSGRFKRRTGSPPSNGSPPITTSLQQSPAGATENGGVTECPQEQAPVAQCSSPPLSLTCKGDLEQSDPGGTASTVAPVPVHQNPPLDWSEPRTGGSPCNQQPLDLSSAAVSRREGSEELGEAALDLSMPGRGTEEGEGSGVVSSGPLQLRKTKPSSSMLQQVLMSDYASVTAPVGDQGTNVAALVTDVAIVTAASVVPADPERLVAELALPPESSLLPSAPSLAPIPVLATQPSSPSSAPGNPTPPVLPSATSSVVMVTSAPAQLLPVSSTTQPVLALLPTEASTSGAETGTDKAPQGNEAQVKTVLPNWGGTVPICLSSAESLQNQTSAGGPPVGEMSLAGPTTDLLSPIPTLQAFAASVNEPAIQSYSIIPNAVVIECTVSLESSQTFVPSFPGSTIESPYGKIILGPSEHLQPYTTPQLQAPKPTAPLAAPAPNTDPPSQSDPSSSTAPPQQETAPSAPSSIKDESKSSDGEPVESTTLPPAAPEASSQAEEKAVKEEPVQVNPLGNNFVCNVCSKPFPSMKELGRHIGEHSEAWPYKCEFCVQLFESAKLFLDHRSTYHGIGKIYVCSVCSKDFAFLCNLQQHQKDLHPGQTCSHTEVEDGRLRPQNYNSPNKDSTAAGPDATSDSSLQENERVTRKKAAKKEEEKEEKEEEFDTATEELYTTIKIMASGMIRSKGPDVRLGINQHYPSFKPPPFPYHNRTPTGSVASATNFTTHNIPQTFSTAIRCTKCGQSFDNMPELHKHILACANASDKRRYTPKKNPIPLKQFARAQNGVLSPTTAANIRQNISRKAGQGGKRQNVSQDSLAKLKLSALNKRKAQLVQKAVSQRNKSAALPKRSSGTGEEEQGSHVCPHCRREFTYRASLSKHIALSCPNKPVSKKARKRKEGVGMSLVQENNANLRRRSPDTVGKQQGALQPQRAKPVVSGAGDHAGLPHLNKGDMKRSSILIAAPAHPIKRSKNGPSSVLSPIPQSNSPHRLGRPPQNGEEPRIQTQNLQTQAAQQSIPIRVRERKGGPVTRSLQQARSMVPPSGQVEAGTAPQPEEPQVALAGRK
ncbi:PR domain zinc finger protein 2 [Alosa pseudoharengus]|uniref:PR domain zinc finger protein 2 n=1 Tax=Alosa pseudoharengus TaxID=34774 RepID=UPI003F8916F5